MTINLFFYRIFFTFFYTALLDTLSSIFCTIFSAQETLKEDALLVFQVLASLLCTCRWCVHYNYCGVCKNITKAIRHLISKSKNCITSYNYTFYSLSSNCSNLAANHSCHSLLIVTFVCSPKTICHLTLQQNFSW